MNISEIENAMNSPNLDPVVQLDDEELESIKAFEKALDDGTLVSHLTPKRQAELQAAATATMNPSNTSDLSI